MACGLRPWTGETLRRRTPWRPAAILAVLFVTLALATAGTAPVAADLDDVSDFVTATTIAGTFDIEYNGGFTTNIPVFDPQDPHFKLDPVFCAYEER